MSAMNIPDAFAFGGRQDHPNEDRSFDGESELIEARRSLLDAWREREALCKATGLAEGLEYDILTDRIFDEKARIDSVAPCTMRSVAIKVWMLAHPGLGIDAIGTDRSSEIALQQVFDFTVRYLDAQDQKPGEGR